MDFCVHVQKIQKARTKRKVTRTYNRTLALGKQMANVVRVDLRKGITTFKKKINPDALLDAYKSGSYGHLLKEIPWDTLHEHIAPVSKGIGDTFDKAAKISLLSLPRNIKTHLRYDTSNPALKRFVNTRTGELIVNVQKDTQKIVQQAVMRSFSEALKPRQVANLIKDSIGLYPKQEQALFNYSSSMYAAGKLSDEKIEDLTGDYADRLLDSRAMTIARTETRNAANQGQLSVWKEASNQDLVPANAQKVWIVDGNPCEICEPMDGIGVPIDGFWVLNDGSVADIPSDAHPNCYCGMELDFGGEPTEGEDTGEEE